MSRIKRIKNPTFTDAEYLAVDPIPQRGEVLLVRDDVTFKVTNWKLGDGFSKYSELSFQSSSIYPHTDLVTNPIGDINVGSSQLDRQISDILRDMISPYEAPAVSGVKNNAAGSAKGTSQLELGQSLGSAISITYSVSNQSNLVSPDPVEVDSFGIFNESNPYPVGAISISPLITLAPTNPVVYTIRVRVNHTNGTSSYVSTFIRFDTRFIWGASNLADLTTTQHALDLIPNGGGQAVQQTYVKTYDIGVGGYGYILIPSILAATPVFTEVSDPNAPASIGMINMGTLSVNNGIGTYNYEKWRTPFLNIGSVKLKAT